MTAHNNQLTNLQLELLKMFQFNLADKQLLEIKELLSNFFAQNIDNELDSFLKANNWTDKTIDNIANEHTRTQVKK